MRNPNSKAILRVLKEFGPITYCQGKWSRNKMTIPEHNIIARSHKEQDLMVVHLVDGVHPRDVTGQPVPEGGNLHGFRAE